MNPASDYSGGKVSETTKRDVNLQAAATKGLLAMFWLICYLLATAGALVAAGWTLMAWRFVRGVVGF